MVFKSVKTATKSAAQNLIWSQIGMDSLGARVGAASIGRGHNSPSFTTCRRSQIAKTVRVSSRDEKNKKMLSYRHQASCKRRPIVGDPSYQLTKNDVKSY